jgi:MbtH protein
MSQMAADGETEIVNPFEDTAASFIVLMNHEDQYSLWPLAIDVPSGWRTVYGPTSRDDALKFVDERWIDMRPRSLQLEE